MSVMRNRHRGEVRKCGRISELCREAYEPEEVVQEVYGTQDVQWLYGDALQIEKYYKQSS